MPPQQNERIFYDGSNTFLPAATAKFGRSPNLVKAYPSKFPADLPFHLRFMATISALIVPSLFYLGPFLLSLPLFLLLLVSKEASIAMLALNIAFSYYPVKPWPSFRKVFQLWYHMYDFHHNMLPNAQQHQLEDTSLMIYSTHPHGIIPIHGYLFCALIDQLFPSRYGFGALTDIAMRLPLLRQVMSWLSSAPAQKRVIRKRMNAGQNLYILPGGVSEIFLACPGHHVIKTPRRGLMKLALQSGAVLVPMYVFGANDFYQQLATLGNQSGSSSFADVNNLFGKFQRKISRIARGGFTFFWGQYGLPLPYNVKCSMVFGDPIESVPGTLGREKTLSGNKLTCEQIENPTDEQIDELHARYTDALIRLFEQYKEQAGYPESKLVLE